MDQNDIRLLNAMRQAIAVFRSNYSDVGHPADKLLALHDRLQFKDRDSSGV